MTYTSRSMFTVPLTSKAYKLANSFQTQYENPAKARQVYLNTLAVYAVDTYCQCLGIETDIEACESLNSVTQPLMDIADLEIEGIGKLECCPVLPQDKDCYIPADTWENRIGYVAVEIDESSREATLLGFYPPINALEMMEQVSLDDFQPLEAFLDHLNRIESALDFFYSDDPVAVKARKRLTDQVFSEIIAQLDRIYRTYDREEWRYAGGDVLASCVTTESPGGDRELLDDSQRIEVQDLAEELLEKLDEIWRDDVEKEQVAIDSSNYALKPVESNQSAIIALSAIAIEGLISLGEWLRNLPSVFESCFQTLESYLNGKEENEVFRFASATRSRSANTEDALMGITAVKEIQLVEHLLALVISCKLKKDEKRDIVLQLYPTGDSTYLPAGVQLIVLEDSGDIFMEATARNADNRIQLGFGGKPEERFSVKVVFGNVSVTHIFVM